MPEDFDDLREPGAEIDLPAADADSSPEPEAVASPQPDADVESDATSLSAPRPPEAIRALTAGSSEPAK